ncbi:MAG: IS630 family transposase [Nitrospiraceae bacterium]
MRPPGSPGELERRRHRAVALLAKGYGPSEVARMLGVDRRSVRRWKAAYRHHGAQALRARRASGRPPKLTPRHLQQVERVLLKGAKAAGFGTDLWTCPRIAQVMAHRFGVRYHVDHLSRLLRALGWSAQKPQPRAVERDEPAIQGWTKQTWPGVKKKPRA